MVVELRVQAKLVRHNKPVDYKKRRRLIVDL